MLPETIRPAWPLERRNPQAAQVRLEKISESKRLILRPGDARLDATHGIRGRLGMARENGYVGNWGAGFHI
jgi:hypothetical protein